MIRYLCYSTSWKSHSLVAHISWIILIQSLFAWEDNLWWIIWESLWYFSCSQWGFVRMSGCAFTYYQHDFSLVLSHLCISMRGYEVGCSLICVFNLCIVNISETVIVCSFGVWFCEALYQSPLPHPSIIKMFSMQYVHFTHMNQTWWLILCFHHAVAELAKFQMRTHLA